MRTLPSVLFPSWLARRADAAAWLPQGEATQSRRLGKSALGGVALHTNREGSFNLKTNAYKPYHEVIAG